MRVTAQPGRGHARIAGVVVLVIVAAAVGYRLPGTPTASAQAAAGAVAGSGAGDAAQSVPAGSDVAPRAARSTAAAHAGTIAATGTPPDGEDPTPDLSDYVLPGEAPTMAEVIDELHRRGIHSGLGAFQPPGTRPPLLGLEVPADFPLPVGYVRHHQATDDGQRIAAILMFSPDLRFVELRGRRVAVPANRVVPPELAPPGMPLRQVRIPPPRDGSGP